MEGHVRTWEEKNQLSGTHFLKTAEEGTSQDTKERDQVRGTHFLETTSGQTSQDTKRKQPSNLKRHSQTGDRRGREGGREGQVRTRK